MKFYHPIKLSCLILMICLGACSSPEQKKQQIIEDDKAFELTHELVQYLNLDQAQAHQVKAINLEAAKKSTELKITHAELPRKLIEGSKRINKERNAAIKEILTPTQMNRMKEMQKRRIKGIPLTEEVNKEKKAKGKKKKKKNGAESKNSMKVAMELAELLKLNAKETIAVRNLYSENAKQKHAAKIKASGNEDKLAASRTTIAAELDEKLLEIISAKQLARFKASRSK